MAKRVETEWMSYDDMLKAKAKAKNAKPKEDAEEDLEEKEETNKKLRNFISGK